MKINFRIRAHEGTHHISLLIFVLYSAFRPYDNKLYGKTKTVLARWAVKERQKHNTTQNKKWCRFQMRKRTQIQIEFNLPSSWTSWSRIFSSLALEQTKRSANESLGIVVVDRRFFLYCCISLESIRTFVRCVSFHGQQRRNNTSAHSEIYLNGKKKCLNLYYALH